ncbi:MAG TPA: hypothetical protein DCL43_13570 [Chitinophagaceae bacterium]|jgi:hypothetical protein|nr:hypothetical protein [Chitinophagaceae bacterium]HAN37505.1 hypothetical protein [Chitinophagaceae bacterium]
MASSINIKKVAAMSMCFVLAQIAFASYTGKSGDKKQSTASLISLKSLALYKKNYSLTSLRPTTWQFKGAFELPAPQQSSSVSLVRMEKGHTTYVFPYKFKPVKVPKFITPMPKQQ